MKEKLKQISKSKQSFYNFLLQTELADCPPCTDKIIEPDREWRSHNNGDCSKPRIGLIGINIHVRTMNYACPLHTYAIQQYLKSLGYDVEILDYVPNFAVFEEFYDYKNPIEYYKTIGEFIEEELQKNGEAKNLRIALSEVGNKVNLARLQEDLQTAKANRFFEFIDKNLNLTSVQYNFERLEHEDPGYDIYMCSTDIIWDKFYSVAYDKGFYLNSTCMKNKWKIAYAASKWTKTTEDDLAETIEMIKNIDFVSVRESFLQNEIQQKVRRDVAWVVDPIFLNDYSLYADLAVIPKEKKYVLLYCVVEQNELLVSEALKCVENLKAKGEDVCLVIMSDNSVHLDIKADSDVEVRYRIDAGINEWLGYIQNASCIYTNSFHGICLGLLFQKDFYAVKRSSYDKIGDMLESINLGTRILNSNHIVADCGPITNWYEVNEKLKERIKQSKAFLENALAIASNPYPIV